MRGFFKHALIEGCKRWGGLMALGGHYHMALVDWHMALEAGLPLLIDLLVLVGLYLEWREGQNS